MTLDAIRAAIPHREPFLLLDEIVTQEPARIVCRKRFRGDEFWYEGHYPGAPITPGVILCEAAMQAGAVLLAPLMRGSSGFPVVTRLNEVRFKRIVLPGETIDIEVLLEERVGPAFFLKGLVTVASAVAVRLQFACTMAPLTALQGPSDGTSHDPVEPQQAPREPSRGLS